MSPETTRKLASLMMRVFGIVVVCYGLSGMFIPDMWLHSTTLLDLPPMDPAHRFNLLSEFRFLHGREIGIGLYALALHDSILSDRRQNIVFLVIAFIAPIGRLYSCVVDGVSSPLFLVFMAIEFTGCFLVWFLTRHVRRPSGVSPAAHA